jgi:DNA-directed RNA polymerase subunit RPC12/RpoP
MFTRIPVKQEQFLLLILEGMPGSHAYAEVYGQDKSKAVCEACASRLLSKAKVQARKAELMAARAARQPMTAAFLSGEALAVAHESRALGQGSAAVAAYQLVAKLNGLIVDKVQQDVLVRKPSASPESPDEMTAEEWMGMVSGSLQTTDKTLTIEHNQNEHGSEEEARALGLIT